MRKKNARQSPHEAHSFLASESPATFALKPITLVPGSPIRKGRQVRRETHGVAATSTTPATAPLKPKLDVPGSSPSSRKGRHAHVEAQGKNATSTPATGSVKPSEDLPGSFPSSRKGRQIASEAQDHGATSTPAIEHLKSNNEMPGSPLSSLVEQIRAHHRERRFAMGIQQVLNRKLESYIRINETDWHPDDDEAARARANKEVAAKIKEARKGKGDPLIIGKVATTDHACKPADDDRTYHENRMEELAGQLPVASWVESVRGFGLPGLATIIAETGDLSNYSNVAKVWKRLGYAPYKDKAMSTWKREKWRNAPALTKEEWIANPFKGQRYGMMYSIADSLFRKQWIGKARTEDGVGKPDGKYGEVYAKRRAHTAETHPDWTKRHAHKDALRKMMKEVLKDLHLEWNSMKKENGGSPAKL